MAGLVSIVSDSRLSHPNFVSTYCKHSVLNVKELVSIFNQEKALVGAFSVIVKSSRSSDDSSTAQRMMRCGQVRCTERMLDLLVRVRSDRRGVDQTPNTGRNFAVIIEKYSNNLDLATFTILNICTNVCCICSMLRMYYRHSTEFKYIFFITRTHITCIRLVLGTNCLEVGLTF